MKERLQKILSRAGVASRRSAEEMILAGRVAVQGQVVKELGARYDLKKDRITVDGKPVKYRERLVYFLLNKPKGFVSTTKDERGRKTVLDLLPEVRERIYPMGRLDNNSEGLLILSNDGRLMNALLHPRFAIPKTYVVRVEGRPREEQLEKLRRGIELDDGLTAPATVERLDYDRETGVTRLTVVITEGRNRQVRRMLAAIGYEVKTLKRTAFASLTIAGLKRGAHRHLSKQEVRELYKLAGLKG